MEGYIYHHEALMMELKEGNMSMIENYLEEYKKAYGDEKALRSFWNKMIKKGAYHTLRNLAQYQNIIFETEKNEVQPKEKYIGSYEVKIYTKEDAEYAQNMILRILADEKK